MAQHSLPDDLNSREHQKFERHGGVVTDSPVLTLRMAYDGSNQMIYVGEALPGSLSSEAFWRIRKLTYDGSNNTVVQWADGDGKFDNIWDNRASLTYT